MGTEEEVLSATSTEAALLAMAQAIDKLTAQQSESKPEPPEDDDPRIEQARKALAQDANRVTPNIGLTTSSVQIDTTDGSREVVLPPATEEQKERRRELGRTMQLHTDVWPVGQHVPRLAVLDAFVSGGPIWLYEYDREFMLTLPRRIKQLLVEDAAEHDLDTAKLMGADILKHWSEGTVE